MGALAEIVNHRRADPDIPEAQISRRHRCSVGSVHPSWRPGPYPFR
jgi:hypothetical protein